MSELNREKYKIVLILIFCLCAGLFYVIYQNQVFLTIAIVTSLTLIIIVLVTGGKKIAANIPKGEISIDSEDSISDSLREDSEK